MTIDYEITLSGKFKKDFKKHLSRHGALGVPERMRPHRLAGQYSGFWECHIFPDLLLIWIQRESPKKLIHLVRLGSHSELF